MHSATLIVNFIFLKRYSVLAQCTSLCTSAESDQRSIPTGGPCPVIRETRGEFSLWTSKLGRKSIEWIGVGIFDVVRLLFGVDSLWMVGIEEPEVNEGE